MVGHAVAVGDASVLNARGVTVHVSWVAMLAACLGAVVALGPMMNVAVVAVVAVAGSWAPCTRRAALLSPLRNTSALVVLVMLVVVLVVLLTNVVLKVVVVAVVV